jgi:hypothetical protein
MATNKQVRESIKRILNTCGEVLLDKGEEYAGDDKDRLLNFKTGALIGSTYNHTIDQKQVLWGYMLKHITSINYMCRMTKGVPDRAQWDEKIGDCINYLLLLSAMIDDEIREEDEPREPSKSWTVIKCQRTKQEREFMKELLYGEPDAQDKK